MPDKTDLLAEILTDLPAGIQDHIETAIPTLTATSAPTDTDAAILTQGVLAHNLNQIFKAFEGLPLVAVLLYLGQLRSVDAGMLVAALELVQHVSADGSAGDFEIVNPTEGASYQPGDVRFQVRPTSTPIQQAAVEIPGEDPLPLQWDDQGFFWGFFRLEAEADYTATVSVLFADDKSDNGTGDTATQDVSFSVAADAEAPAEGGDFGPIEYAREALSKAAGTAKEAVQQNLPETTTLINDFLAYARKFVQTTWQEIEDESREAWETTKEDLEILSGLINDAIAAKNARGLSPEDQAVITIIGEIEAQADVVYSEAAQAWFAANPHPPTGYATSPDILKGAAAAMNEKYGPGAVYYEGL